MDSGRVAGGTAIGFGEIRSWMIIRDDPVLHELFLPGQQVKPLPVLDG
jgi:hypothetical protein